MVFRTGAGVNIEPGTRKVQSVNADGIHLQGVAGRILLDGAVSRESRDDGANIYNFDAAVHSSLTTSTVITHSSLPFVVGDEVKFSDQM